MIEFDKYQHIERIGTENVQNIEMGTCYIFPKIDGTNSQLWWTIEDGIGRLHAGSRNRELSYPDGDNQGFFRWCIEERGELFASFFRKHPNLRLYGEWLVPHTLKTYRDDAWRKMYVFDVKDGERYLSYEEYQPLLEEFNIEYIPPICKVENPSYERLINQLEKNEFLIADGNGSGEGIVIKNYEFRNKFGHVVWAKIVKNEFKASHAKAQVTELKESKLVEQEIVNRYITLSLIDKEIAKIVDGGEWQSKYIPRLLNTVYYCLITEESWNFIKEFKNPTIDFKKVMYFTTAKIKELKPKFF